jgi:predicted RNase H-like HicB family nuclease
MVEEARKNLIEALELFFKTADSTEIKTRLHGEITFPVPSEFKVVASVSGAAMAIEC